MGCRSNKNIDKDKVCLSFFIFDTIITGVGMHGVEVPLLVVRTAFLRGVECVKNSVDVSRSRIADGRDGKGSL